MGVVNEEGNSAETLLERARGRLAAGAIALATTRADWYATDPAKVEDREAAWRAKASAQLIYEVAERSFIEAYREDKITRGS